MLFNERKDQSIQTFVDAAVTKVKRSKKETDAVSLHSAAPFMLEQLDLGNIVVLQKCRERLGSAALAG